MLSDLRAPSSARVRGVARAFMRLGLLAHARAAWPVDGVSARGLRVALSGPAAALGLGMLEPRLSVEQELAVRGSSTGTQRMAVSPCRVSA